MDFLEACNITKDALSKINININCDEYDGLIVKVLRASNTLDDNRSTNQTHVAITGKQMDMFPYLRADGYLNSETLDHDLKKYFIGQIPIYLSKANLSYLSDDECDNDMDDENRFIKTKTSVLRSTRRGQSEQLQLSLLDADSPKFIEFRKKSNEGSCLIILKRKNVLEYEAYSIKPSDVNEQIKQLNNKFFKLLTNTLVDITNDFKVKESKEVYYSDRLKYGENVLLYGVPGSGKSYKIETEYCNDFKFMERVVFHPDYMNTDFVGQILPTVKGEGDEKEITYDFTPGPFTRVLKKAIENPGNYYYLVIEEINRGNAPAIFGEIFQLLDRDDVGKSSYEITNYNIANEVFDEKEKPIYLPSNLHILATMNTADQNVFTLDTAFQRRWDMKMIENDVSKAEHASKSILDTNVTWERFNTIINDQIITSSVATLSSEDKRLGAYFVTEEILKYYSKEENLDDVIQKYSINDRDADKIDKAVKDLNSRFGDKVIKYLWDDAFKFSRDELFDVEYKSLEKVLDTFNYSVGEDRFNVFNQDIKENLYRILDTEDSDDE